MALAGDNGQIVETYRSDAWGNTTVHNTNGAQMAQSKVGNRIVWQGREINWKTGLLFHRTRVYIPQLGRWASPDKIGIAGGGNLYQAFGNAPTASTDPFGLCETQKSYDMSDDVRQYVNDLRKANLSPWNPLDWWAFYKFSISPDRDTKWDQGTFRFEQYAGGGAEMGNFKAGYALSEVYGPTWAVIMTRGAEMVAPAEGTLHRRGHPDRRSSDNLFTVFVFDPKGSFEWNDRGIAQQLSEQLVVQVLEKLVTDVITRGKGR